MKKIVLLVLTAISIFLFGSSFLIAADGLLDFSQEGIEFWVCFTQNYKQDINIIVQSEPNKELNIYTPELKLFITSAKDAHVTVEMSSSNIKKDISVQGGSMQTVELGESAITLKDGIGKGGIHITSDVPVSISGLNTMKQSTDTYTALPVQSLGTEYAVMSYTNSTRFMSDFVVIATEDNTNVIIKPSSYTRDGKNPNEEFSIKLNKGETYLLTARYLDNQAVDLTGSIIKSDKKVAVFGCHQCAYVPEKVFGCNHLSEQLLPVQFWGRTYIAGKMAMRSKSTLRVLAYFDKTEIKINGNKVKDLNKGEFYQDNVTNEDRMIEASQPVMCAMFSHGFKDGDTIGDPMMFLLRPTNIYSKSYRVTPPFTGSWKHFVNVIVPAKALKDLKIDGKYADGTLFKEVPGSGFMSAQLEVVYGPHLFECSMPFGISSYGFGTDENAWDAYGNF